MKGKKLAGLVIVIYVLFVAVCSLSWLSQLSFKDAAAGITKSVALEEGVFKKDTEELRVVLHDGETEKLAEFTALKTADFRGSECVDEIYRWAQAHPEVTVYYDVALPDGGRAENAAQAVNFTGIGHASLEEYMACLEYLPDVSSVDLGDSDSVDDPLTAEDLTRLFEEYPDKTFSYSFMVNGTAYSLQDTELDLSALSPDDVEDTAAVLPCLKNLVKVNLGDESGSALDWGDIEKLTAACPQADFEYSFTLYGKSFSLTDETIDLSKTQIDDDGAAVVAALPALYRCGTLDMDDGGVVTGLSNERMQEIREAFPDIDVIWRIWFGTNYSVRTDTERILASIPSVGGMLDDNEVAKLKYCTKVKYLDLGHNEWIYDISFVSSMPELEVFIIAMSSIAEINALADCPKLEYLEIFTTHVSDLTPLSNAKNLRHLNISCLTDLTDISPLYGLTELERLWIGSVTPIPQEQIDEMQKCAPNCKISTASEDPHGDSWRYTWYDENNATYHWVERYRLLMDQLGYTYRDYSFYWLDTKCYKETPAEYAGIYGNPDLQVKE